jgi:multiple sugar transport system permease protein
MARAETLSIPKPRVRSRSLHRQDWPWALLFLGPNLVLFAVFMAYPIFSGLYMSFFDWKIVTPPEWVGLQNYVDIVQDPLTRTLVWNTLFYVIGSIVPLLVFALGCAVLLNAVISGKTFWRGIYFLPLVTSPVAAAAVWKWLYAQDQGLLNYFLVQVGVPRLDWLYSTVWAMPAVIVMTVWKLLPFNTILFLAGLQEIPGHLYEAAAIDGASRWRQFRDITVPLVTPTTFLVLLVTMLSLLFGSFDIINVMTQGGPLDATNIFIYDIYRNAFQYLQMGYASAQAYILFIVVLLITLLNWWLQKRWVHYE